MNHQTIIKTICDKPYAFDPTTILKAENLNIVSPGAIERILGERMAESAHREKHRKKFPEMPPSGLTPERVALVERIVAILRDHSEPLTARRIRDVTKSDYGRVMLALTQLAREGRATSDRPGRFMTWRLIE